MFGALRPLEGTRASRQEAEAEASRVEIEPPKKDWRLGGEQKMGEQKTGGERNPDLRILPKLAVVPRQLTERRAGALRRHLRPSSHAPCLQQFGKCKVEPANHAADNHRALGDPASERTPNGWVVG